MYRYRVIILVQIHKGIRILSYANEDGQKLKPFHQKSFILTNSYFYFGAVFIVSEFDNKFQDGIKYFHTRPLRMILEEDLFDPEAKTVTDLFMKSIIDAGKEQYVIVIWIETLSI
ncbi:unnamed protein product [Rhizophagus irregularis]|nr:unnamed protein product [Rhizophagus irregularis]